MVGCGSDGGGGGGGDHVRVTAALAPAAVIAYRDGDGPWATKSGAETPFTFDVTSGEYTVVVACNLETGGQPVQLYQLTTNELTELDYKYECSPTAAMLSGQLLGNDGPGVSGNLFQWGPDAGYRASAGPTTWGPLPVRAGKHDLLATRGIFYVDRLLITRDVEVPPDAQVDIDFNGPQAVATEFRTITGGPVLTGFVSAGGTVISLGQVDGADPRPVVPVAALADGDLNLFAIDASSGIEGLREVQSTVHASREAPASLSVLPRILDRPTVWASQSGEYLLLHTSWAPQPGAVLYRFDLGWVAYVSPAIFDATGTYALPDLSAVPGWDPTVGLTPGFPPTRAAWRIRMMTGGTVEELLRPYPTSEGEVQMSGWAGDEIAFE